MLSKIIKISLIVLGVPEDKFSEFNLMQKSNKLGSELIPEQCGIVASQF